MNEDAQISDPKPLGTNPLGLPHAGFWRRCLGWFIDYVLTAFATILSAYLLTQQFGSQAAPPKDAVVGFYLLYLLLPLLYAVFMESSRLQATLGKLAVGIKVTDVEGNRISIPQALGRYLAHILDGLTMGVGFAMAACTEKRQALHDKIASTLVVRQAFDAAAVRSAGSAPTSGMRTTIAVVGVMLFGPFGLGIFAAIAIPAYQNYTIRAQIAEGLNAADALKAAVTLAASQGTSWSDINSMSLNLKQPSGLKYVQSIEVESGAIVIQYGGSANTKIRDARLLLFPATSADNKIFWICGGAAVPEGAIAVIESAAQYTTVKNQYLPTACRQ